MSWFIASIYLLCGAFRLARFNCLSAMHAAGGGKDFLGFPIPSAAGLVASLTLLIIHFNEKEKSLGHWNYLIAVGADFPFGDDGEHGAVSQLQIPRACARNSTFMKAIGVALFVGCILTLREKILYYVLPSFFTLYLVYGFVRPSLSRAWRREIEEEDDDEPDAAH